MKTKTLLTALTTAALAVGSASAASIAIPDYSLVPDGSTFGTDGTNTSTQLQKTNINALNGNTNVLPGGAANSPDVIYLISTFTWGANSDAHFFLNFAITNGADRLGVAINDEGVVSSYGDGTNTSNDFDFEQDMAGQSVTILAKLHYDVDNSVTYSQASASNDTLMNVWINPTTSSVEGSGTSAGDFFTIWNSAGFPVLEQRIDNQSTPGTAGTSSITDTVILTGNDATFENALLAAGVPEPSSLALLGLGGLLIARRRRA